MAKLLKLIRRHQDDVPLILLFAAGLVGAYTQATLPARHGGEMWNLAWNLADHGTFANPFNARNIGLTASNPPLAPFLSAALIRAFRVPFLIYTASALLSILANAVSAALLPRLSRTFFGDLIPGVFAAILWLFTMQVIPGWDTNYTSAGLICFACVTGSIFTGTMEAKVRLSICAGLVAGALCLLNPTSILVWLPWLVFLYVRVGFRNRQAIAASAIILLVTFLTSAGWAIRNERTIGAYVIRTGLGIELYVSDNDCAEPTILQEEMSGCFQSHHPNSSAPEAEEFVRLGEIQYDKVRTTDALSWIQKHPRRFTELTWSRLLYFWFPKAEKIPVGFSFGENFGHPDYMEKWQSRQNRIAYAIWICTILSLIGLALMIRARLPVVWFIIVSLGVYPIMFYITIFDVRYRDPVLWISLLPAGYFLTRLVDRDNSADTNIATASQS